MEQLLCCTTCPSECELTVTTKEDGTFDSVTGNRCKRGDAFARQEISRPVRVLTSTIRLEGGKYDVLVPVRSDKAFPLDMHHDAMDEVRKLCVKAPIKMGDVIRNNFLGQDISLVASCDAD